MPRKTLRDVIPIARGFRSSECAAFVAEMNELTDRMWKDLRGMTARQLAWRPAPGRNSIGMLLAHLAIVETAWIGGPASGQTAVDFPKLIGIGADDDGMPAPPNGRHPRSKRGRR